MADTPRCKNDNCSKKEMCYRFNVPEDKEHKSEVLFKNICNEKNNYKLFWEIPLKPVVEEKE